MASSTCPLTWCCTPEEAATPRSRPVRFTRRPTRRIPAGPPCGPHQVEPQNQTMPEGETRHAVQNRDDSRTRVEALLVRPPGLPRATGDRKTPGRLTLGEALGLQIARRRKQIHACEALPALVAILVAVLCLWDYRAHSSLLFPSCALVFVMAKDGEVAFSFQPFWGQVSIVWVISETKWPTR